MASKLIYTVLGLSICAAMLFVSASNAQESSKESPKDTISATGTLQAARKTLLSVDAKSYGGELKLKSLVAPGTVVKEGDIVAVVDAPDFADEKAAFEANAEASKNAASWWETALNSEVLSTKMRLERLKLNAEAAKKNWDQFNATGKQDRITGSELNVQYWKDSIEDQEEELRQLEALYKGNDLAKESQDIVIRRSKRRLEQSRTRLKLVINDHEELLKITLPHDERNLKLNVESSKFEFEALAARAELGLYESTAHFIRSQADWAATKKRARWLTELKPSWEIKAPHAGIVLHAGDAGADGATATFTDGAKIANGQQLAWILDTSTLRVTVQLAGKDVKGAHSQKNPNLSAAALGVEKEARVVGVGSVVREGKVAVICEVANQDGNLMHGQEVMITFAGR